MKTYLFKASWRGTAMQFKVQAKNEKQAQYKAEGQVSRMEGADTVIDITLIREVK